VKDSKAKQTTDPEVMKTPTLTSKNYTTGRGGTGNIAKNDDPDEARIAQDVDVPAVMLQEGSRHVGRGKQDPWSANALS